MAGIKNDVIVGKNADYSQTGAPNATSSESNGLVTNGQLWIGSTALNAGGTHINVGTLTSPDASITFGYSSPNITAVVNGGAPYISLTPYIVGSDIHSGFATIASAIAQAVADGASSTNPKNIYIKPKSGGYTENLTIQDGIHLIGFGSSSFIAPSTTQIIGKITMTATGKASINGLVLTTNGDYVVEVTGANIISVILFNCMINATNNNAIHLTNANSTINLFHCHGLITGAIAYFVSTGGAINAYYCLLAGANATASTFADGNFTAEYTTFNEPITTSGTSALSLLYCEILPAANSTAVTHGGSGLSYCSNTRFASGNASAVSIGGTLPMINCVVDSTNANAITGAGTLQYAFIAFTNTSSTVNTATQTPLATLI